MKVDLISLSDLVGRDGKSESFEMSKIKVGLALFCIIRTKWLGVHVPMPENGVTNQVRGLKLRFSMPIDFLNEPLIDG